MEIGMKVKWMNPKNNKLLRCEIIKSEIKEETCTIKQLSKPCNEYIVNKSDVITMEKELMTILLENKYNILHNIGGHIEVYGKNKNDIVITINNVFELKNNSYDLCIIDKDIEFDSHNEELEYEDKYTVTRKSLNGALKYIKENLK